MNYRLVINVIAKLLLIEATLMLLPLLVAVIDGGSDIRAFLLSIIICVIVGGLVSLLRVPDSSIRIRESFCIVSLGWLTISAFGALPLFISGMIGSYADALFEALSWFSTTGASILPSMEMLPRGLLFWRSFAHWIGGMGILVFTLALLPAMGAGSFTIIKAEAPGPTSKKLIPTVKNTAIVMYSIYVALTLLEIVLLLFGGMSLYDAVIHAFGTLGTGGCSTRDASVAYYNSPYIYWVISIFMLMSGVNFSLYYVMLKGRLRDILYDEELRLYLIIIGIATLIVMGDLMINRVFEGGFFDSLTAAFFHTTSITTTTGYAAANFDAWPPLSRAMLFLLFFVGGCTGSTGGSVKSIRLLIAGKCLRREIKQVIHPRMVIPIKVNKKVVAPAMTNVVTCFVMLYVLLFALGTLAVIGLEGLDITTAGSAVAACLGNIGVGFGGVGPLCNYAAFGGLSKLILGFLMLAGRLEIYTVLVMFVPSLWKK